MGMLLLQLLWLVKLRPLLLLHLSLLPLLLLHMLLPPLLLLPLLLLLLLLRSCRGGARGTEHCMLQNSGRCIHADRSPCWRVCTLSNSNRHPVPAVRTNEAVWQVTQVRIFFFFFL
jgi:hypothetical protein